MMMMWNVEVTSKETISPSTPTLPHLHTHNLSRFDSIIPDRPISFILFYPNSNANSLSTLKTSLSQTLSLFYPLAGRLSHDATVVYCNDRGVDLTEARATADAPLSRLVPCSNLDSLKLLLPCDIEDGGSWKVDSGALLFIQLTTFVSCGGIAIGCCFSHMIADGHSVAAFITAWAATACGGGSGVSRPVSDAASLFPPPSHCQKDLLSALRMTSNAKPVVTRRFVFRESAISSLRDQSSVSLTRVQAVTALVWRCCVRAREKKQCCSVARIVVNMRGRALPEELFGNLFFIVAAALEINEAESGFEEKITGAIKGIDVERLKRFKGNNEWGMVYEKVTEAMKECGGSDHVDSNGFSSWNGFPFYEADFGWGMPIWVGVATQQTKNTVFLTGRGDGAAGGGIEAWVTLEEEDMRRFESDREITANEYPELY